VRSEVGNKGSDVAGRLWLEKQWWDAVYPEFQTMTKVEFWGGSDALMIPEDDEITFRESVHGLLLNFSISVDIGTWTSRGEISASMCARFVRSGANERRSRV
jgi:hypothetical protein